MADYRRKFAFRRIGLAVILGVLTILSQGAIAQKATPITQSALSVSPAIMEQVLTPDTPAKSVVRVTNITRIPLPIKASVKNLTPLEDLLPDAAKETYDASGWYNLEPADFILQPNQTKEIAISIAPPPQATPGGHYATIYFQPLVPTEALSPSTAYLNARVGVLSFLIVKGDIVERVSLASPVLPKLKQFGPVDIKLPVTNNGNVHVLPEGKVTIRDFRGKAITSMTLPPGLVLPKTVREYKMSWDNAGKMGYFTAQADLTYGSGNERLQTESVGFWILPWLPMAFLTVLVSLVVLFVLKTRRRWSAAWSALRGSS